MNILSDITARLRKWCSDKNLSLGAIDEVAENRLFEIPKFGKFYLLLPIKNKLIAKGMYFNLADEDELEICKQSEYLLFEFGRRFYYCKPEIEKDEFNDERLNANFNDLLYLGAANIFLPSYSHLGVHTEYEMLNGNNLKDHVAKAKFLSDCEVNYLGMCDKHTLAGTLPFQVECEKKDLNSIIGACYDVVEKIDQTQAAQSTYEVKLYVIDSTGWQSLLAINKCVNVDYNKFVPEADLFKFSAGLVCVLNEHSFLDFADNSNWNVKLRTYQKHFKHIYIQIDSVEYFDDAIDMRHLEWQNAYFNIRKSASIKLPAPVLINDSYYPEKDQAIVKEYLNKVSKIARDYSQDQHYKTTEEIVEKLMPLFGEGVEGQKKFYDFYNECETGVDAICKLCGNFRIETGERKFPKYEYAPDGLTNAEYFEQRIAEGFQQKVIEADKDVEIYMQRVEKELEVIKEGGLIDYLLILVDICDFCRENAIPLGPGRGSVAGSLIAFLIGITKVDSVKYGLLFERFLDSTRTKPKVVYEIELTDGRKRSLNETDYTIFKSEKPKNIKSVRKVDKYPPDSADIDTDICELHRDEVKEYISMRFGEFHTCSIGTYTKLQLKGSIKNFGTVKGLSFDFLNVITKKIENQVFYYFRDLIDYCVHQPELKKFAQTYPEIIHATKFALNQPLAASIHASAVLILPKETVDGEAIDIFQQLPVRLMDGKYVCEFEGKMCDLGGYLKEDILGLSQLSKLENILRLIKKNYNIDIDLEAVNYKDKKTFDLFQKGYNEDVFQLNSPGLKNFSKSVKPDCFEDLAAMTALYRPGPMKSNAHTDFALFKHGKKKAKYDYGLKEVTKDTQGLFIFQEQMMKALEVLGGFTLERANSARAMIKKFNKIDMALLGEDFIAGAIKNGCSEKEAKSIWDKLVAFSGYGFNMSHSYAYSMLTYWCQWLKANYPLEFWTTALQWSEEDDIPGVINELRIVNKEITLKPPSINNSEIEFKCDPETNYIYWSLLKIKGIGRKIVKVMIDERNAQGQFGSYDDFVKRIPKGVGSVNRRHITFLILSGAFDEIEGIAKPAARLDLLQYHAKAKAVELTDEFKDTSVIYKNYFWILQQKKLTGYGNINYRELLDKKLAKQFMDYDEVQAQKDYTTVVIAGQVFSLKKMKKKKKEEFFFIMEILCNTAIQKVLIWEDISADFEQLITELPGKQVAMEGETKYDNYSGCVSIYISEFKFTIL